MKRLLLLISALLLFDFSNAQLNRVDIVATGLTCSMCSNAIYKQLQSIVGVDRVDVDLNKNLFSVVLKKEQSLTPKDFKEKVEKAGFFVGSMIVYINFVNLAIEDGKKESNYIFIDTNSKILNGEVQLKVQDEGYVTAKEFKKLTKTYIKYTSYAKKNDDVYHLKLL